MCRCLNIHEPFTPTPGKIGNRAGLVPLKELSEVPVPNDDLARKMTDHEYMSEIQWYAVRLYFSKKDGLGDGFNHFLFSPLPGEMIQFD